MNNDELAQTQVIEVQDSENEERKKKPAKKKKKMSKTVALFFQFLFVAAILVAVYSGWQIYSGLREYAQSRDTYTKLSQKAVRSASADATAEPFVRHDFEQLAAINPNTIGWISMADSTVDYPVVQGTDNTYYLNHLFDDTPHRSGAIYMNCDNDPACTDKNTIFYGHHMRDGSMFHDIAAFDDAQWAQEHPEIIYETPDAVYRLEPFAGIVGDGQSDYVQTSFDSDEEFMQYVQDKIDHSTFKSDIVIQPQDQIVTLSTCIYVVEDGRYALFCKLTKLQ